MVWNSIPLAIQLLASAQVGSWHSHPFRWDSFVLPRQSWAASHALPEDRLCLLMAKTHMAQGTVTAPDQQRIAKVCKAMDSVVRALWGGQSQEPSWIEEPLNCFSSELCQTPSGVLEVPPSLGQGSRLCPFSYPVKEHSARIEMREKKG